MSVKSGQAHSHELALERVDAMFEAEALFRGLFSDRYVSLFHATRLLPHGEASVLSDGLLTLSEEHRGARLDQVILGLTRFAGQPDYAA